MSKPGEPFDFGDQFQEALGLYPSNPNYSTYRHQQQGLAKFDEIRGDLKRLATPQSGSGGQQSPAAQLGAYVERVVRTQEISARGITNIDRGVQRTNSILSSELSAIRETGQQHLGVAQSHLAVAQDQLEVAERTLGVNAQGFQTLINQGDDMLRGLQKLDLTISGVGEDIRDSQREVAGFQMGAPMERKQHISYACNPQTIYLLEALSALSDTGESEARDVTDWEKRKEVRSQMRGKYTVIDLVRAGVIDPIELDDLARQGKLDTRTTESLMESGIIKGQLGTSMRINKAMEDIRSVQVAAYAQDTQRNALLGDIATQSHAQTELQQGLLASSQRAEVLLRAGFETLIGQMDTSNARLDQFAEDLLHAVHLVEQGVSSEIALTRLAITQHLEGLSVLTRYGLSALQRESQETNQHLQSIFDRLGAPLATEADERCRSAIGSIISHQYEDAINYLGGVDKGHSFEMAYFLLGLAYVHEGKAQDAVKALNKAAIYAIYKENAEIAENAVSLLADIAIHLHDTELAEKVLSGLIGNEKLRNRLEYTHMQYASLMAMMGDEDLAIRFTCYQLMVNPPSLPELLENPYLVLISHPDNANLWAEIMDEISKSIHQSGAAATVNIWRALSIIVAFSAEYVPIAQTYLRITIDKWLEVGNVRLKSHFQEYLRQGFPTLSESFLNQVLDPLGQEEEYNWLHNS